jgi:hypothetical protein
MTLFGQKVSIKGDNIYEQWMEAKAAEAAAVAKRRELEDQLSNDFELNEMHEGSMTKKQNGYVIKITQRLNKKIDQDQLNSIVNENGLEDVADGLFRFKPEIDKKAWSAADSKITDLLSEAITMKAGRPSYNILKEE